MIPSYQIKLSQQGKQRLLILPEALKFTATEVTIRQENEKLIIEPLQKESLLETLSNLEDIEEEFPNIDDEILPLDSINF